MSPRRVSPLLAAAAPIGPQLSATLDLARWSAAGLVVLYHLRLNVLPGSDLRLRAGAGLGETLLALAGSCGPQAVYWFFVVSGFLVGGGALADVARGRFALGRYGLSRAVRIFVVLVPALAVGLGFDLLRVGLHGLDLAGDIEAAEAYAPTTLVGNLLFLQTLVVPSAGSNVPLWSLANEAWYYLLFGAALGCLARRSVRAAAACAAAFFVAGAAVGSLNQSILLLFPLWLLGVAARLAPRPLMRSMPLAWGLAIGASLAHPYLRPHLHGLAHALVALAVANVLVTAMHSPRVPDPRRARVHALLAGFSFSLYVTHAPLLHLLMTVVSGGPGPRLASAPANLSTWIAVALVGAICLLFAYVFSRMTEAHTMAARARAATLLERGATMLRRRLLADRDALP